MSKHLFYRRKNVQFEKIDTKSCERLWIDLHIMGIVFFFFFFKFTKH